MSGHSHFKTIKATKDANDAKRGKIFSELARVITLAVKEKGKDTTVNSALKTAIEKAKEFNMPKENIERAIKKGTGELAGENLEELSVEGFGPGGIAIIIEGITDNKNRTIGEIKSTLSQFDGKMAGEGSVKWMFVKKGIILAEYDSKQKEEIEILAIESGAEDIRLRDEGLEIFASPENLDKVKKFLQEKGVKIESAFLGWAPKEEMRTSDRDGEKFLKLFEELNNNDAVQNIYSNME